MIIETLEIPDWEPLIFRLVPAERITLNAAAVGRFVHAWFRKRKANPVCQMRCREKFVSVEKLPGGDVRVAAEWVCPDCLNVLIVGLGERFSDIERVRIGFDHEVPQTPPEPAPASVVAFTGRTVTYEDGRTEPVADFQIVNAIVTVGEMQKFCDQTGYVTSAERRGPQEFGIYDTYKENVFLRVVEPVFHPVQEANFLSYYDAIAYCTWSGHRVLTEGEFFVGALFDDAVHPTDPKHKDVVHAFHTGKVAFFANSGSGIVTQTRVRDQIVLRFGPNIVKSPGWQSRCHRRLVDADDPAGRIVRVLND